MKGEDTKTENSTEGKTPLELLCTQLQNNMNIHKLHIAWNDAKQEKQVILCLSQLLTIELLLARFRFNSQNLSFLLLLLSRFTVV